MSENRGKQFEVKIKEAFERVPNTVVIRLHDQVTRYVGSTNPCDFIVYRKPVMLAIECKSVHGNTLSIYSNPKPDKNGVLHGLYGNITDKQWEGLLEMSKAAGGIAGIICWWVDKDVTRFLPIQSLKSFYDDGTKSVRYDFDCPEFVYLQGEKKRVFFDYDMSYFLKEVIK